MIWRVLSALLWLFAGMQGPQALADRAAWRSARSALRRGWRGR